MFMFFIKVSTNQETWYSMCSYVTPVLKSSIGVNNNVKHCKRLMLMFQ